MNLNAANKFQQGTLFLTPFTALLQAAKNEIRDRINFKLGYALGYIKGSLHLADTVAGEYAMQLLGIDPIEVAKKNREKDFERFKNSAGEMPNGPHPEFPKEVKFGDALGADGDHVIDGKSIHKPHPKFPDELKAESPQQSVTVGPVDEVLLAKAIKKAAEDAEKAAKKGQ